MICQAPFNLLLSWGKAWTHSTLSCRSTKYLIIVFRPTSWIFLTFTLVFNIGAMVHLNIKKRNGLELMKNMGGHAKTSQTQRYNPTLMQGMAEFFTVAFMLGCLIVMMKNYPINKLSILYLIQLTGFFVFVAFMGCFFTKGSLRKHVRVTLRLDKNAIVPYTTKN